jgi:hypothetical protein
MRGMAKESRRMPTATGFSLPLKTPFPPSTSLANLISSFRYEGAFEKNERHGQGIETDADGYRYFSSFKDSFPPFHLSCEFNFFY